MTEPKQPHLHFTCWPVQEFIVQARRTRDLWAGSYLLSYLAGKAIQAIGPQQILFPAVQDDPMLNALNGPVPVKSSTESDFQPFQRAGSLPTCFMAVPEADAESAVRALRKAWENLADIVWRWVSERNHPCCSIWNQQVGAAWTCYWVKGDYSDLHDRKHWRTPAFSDEAGEKCSICGQRQEISGKGMGTPASREAMRAWWTKLAAGVNGRKGLHLRTNTSKECTEQLCMVCLIKRLLPLNEIATKAFGWQLPANVPSVSYMAAADWLKQCLEKAPTAAIEFAQAAHDARVPQSENHIHLPGINRRLNQVNNRLGEDKTNGVLSHKEYRRQLVAWRRLMDLDGSVFFEDELLNNELGLDHDNQRKLLKCLRKLYDAMQSRPSPFYAILFMDGDSTGDLLDGCNDAERQAISRCITDFSRQVPDLVAARDGWLIYAGGEDVFALLPLDTAISCAVQLQRCYRECFQQLDLNEVGRRERLINSATISAAINFVSIHTALSVAVRDTRRLLEDYAKSQMGRATLACRVWKRGGPILTWSLPWQRLLPVDTASADHPTLLDQVISGFKKNSDDSSRFSSGFFYQLGDLFELLKSADGTPLDITAVQRLLTVEYLGNRETWPPTMSEADRRREAEKQVDLLLQLCRETRREVSRNRFGEIEKESLAPGRLRADGALLVRFLAQKGLD